ncbi:MAG: type II and III secretion system protein family protein, partial [Syntrophorhabdus sp.]
VKPFDKKKQAMPTDQFVDPNDFEFYLLGKVEGMSEPEMTRGQVKSRTVISSDPDNKLGHIIPED